MRGEEQEERILIRKLDQCLFKYIGDCCKEEELLHLLSIQLQQGRASLICSKEK